MNFNFWVGFLWAWYDVGDGNDDKDEEDDGYDGEVNQMHQWNSEGALSALIQFMTVLNRRAGGHIIA